MDGRTDEGRLDDKTEKLHFKAVRYANKETDEQTDLSVRQRWTVSASIETRFDDVTRPRLASVAASVGRLTAGPVGPVAELAVTWARDETHLLHYI